MHNQSTHYIKYITFLYPLTAQNDPTSTLGLPTAITIAAAIFAGTFLLLILFMVCIIVFFAHMRKKFQSSQQRSNTQAPPTAREPSAPKSTLRNERSRKAPPKSDSGVHVSRLASSQRPQPREILAYRDVDLSDTFQPLPPPHSLTTNPGMTLYDIPEAVYGEDGRMMEKSSLNGSPLHRVDAHNTYDEVDMIQNSPRRDRVQTGRPSDPHSRGTALHFQHKSSGLPTRQHSPYDQVYQEQLEPSMLHNTQPNKASAHALPYGPIYDVPKAMKAPDDILHISLDNIIEIQELGMGRFGAVSLAATIGLSFKDIHLGGNSDKNRSLLVAIKKLSSEGGDLLRQSFEREIRYTSQLHHPNIIQLLGVCTVGEPFVMLEYMENGDLNQFLQKQIVVEDSVSMLQEDEVSPLVLLYMTVQVASGMRYLASQRVVHRDIATRNCLVGRDFVVKISDFGMSHKLYESSYYRVHGLLTLPIRWMPYESFYGKFSVKSDVWAFGITMWEIYTLARHEPYHTMTDEELISDTMKGDKRKRPEKPYIVPNAIYDVMLRCWVHDPFMRGDFEEIYSRLFLAYTCMCQQSK